MDHKLKIRTYTPDASSYSPRISSEQWDQHKTLLKQLHDRGLKRADMLDILRRHSFNPSMGQLNAKMTAWGFKVYGTQTEPQDQDYHQTSDPIAQVQSFDSMDTEVEGEPTLSPTSRTSVSSMTLCEPEPKPHNDRFLTLDEVIISQTIEQRGSYVPSTSPSDFGFKSPDKVSAVDGSWYHFVVSIADFLCAVHCFEQAFDLYQFILEHLLTSNLIEDASLVRGLVQCAISATTDFQCNYALSILRRVHSYCVEHMMIELTSCFQILVKDLCTRNNNDNNSLLNTERSPSSDMALLIATDPIARSIVPEREWLQQQLAACDELHSTLVHLSSWCQDTLSFHKLENQVIVRSPPKTTSDGLQELTSFEHDFQVIASSLIIDYLNSPGPSMKRADVECKEDQCAFRSVLPPSTSLLVMAHLLYEPLRLQSQTSTSTFLRSRAQQFANMQSTTALIELKSFATTDSRTRCGAFVDTFMKHFITTLAFRRFTASIEVKYIWDRMNAARRLAQLLMNTQLNTMPHAGLPGARRALMRTAAAPFSHDPVLAEGRRSIASESSSMRDFETLAFQIDGSADSGGTMGALTPSDAMSIDTRSSWSFHHATGFPAGGLSHSNSFSSRGGLSHSNSISSHRLPSRFNSISSRRGDLEEVEEYRHFIKENNYSQQTLAVNPETPKNTYATMNPKDSKTK